MVKKLLVGALLLACATSSSIAKDLFNEGKPIEFTKAYPLEAGTTIGGYPIYKGDGKWMLWDIADRTIAAANATSETRLGLVQLDQVEPTGDWVATQYVMVVTRPIPRGSYVNGNPCGGTHMVAIDRSTGRDDNCLTIDADTRQWRGHNPTYFNVNVTQTRSGDRRYLIQLQLNAEWLGFRNTRPEDWNVVSALQASPERQAFAEKLKAWASQLQLATENILDYAKPQDVFDGIPSFRALKLTAE